MAQEPSSTDGRTPHKAQVNVDRLSKEILARGQREIMQRREREARVGQAAREEPRDASAAPAPRDRSGRTRASRAHTTVMGTTESLPGAPRSGSA